METEKAAKKRAIEEAKLKEKEKKFEDVYEQVRN